MSGKALAKRGGAITFRDIAQDWLVVLDWIDEYAKEIEKNGGVLPPVLQELIDKIEGDTEKKAESIALVARVANINVGAIKEEIHALEARKKYFERVVDQLKQYSKMQLTTMKLDRVEAPLARIRLQSNPQPEVDIYDLNKVPAGFLTFVEPTPDKRRLLDELRPKLPPNGAFDWIDFPEWGLRIRKDTHVRFE